MSFAVPLICSTCGHAAVNHQDLGRTTPAADGCRALIFARRCGCTSLVSEPTKNFLAVGW